MANEYTGQDMTGGGVYLSVSWQQRRSVNISLDRPVYSAQTADVLRHGHNNHSAELLLHCHRHRRAINYRVLTSLSKQDEALLAFNDIEV